MSLKQFHLFFIGVCVLLCVWVTGWGLAHLGRSTDAAALSVVGAAGFGGLTFYLRWFLGKLKSGGFRAAVLAAPAVLAALPSDAWSCAVCFGAPDGDIVRAFNWGIFFLAAVTFATLGGITAMMLSAIRRKDANR